MKQLRIMVVVSILGAMSIGTACNNSSSGSQIAESQPDRQALTSEPSEPAAAINPAAPSDPTEATNPDDLEVPDRESDEETVALINEAVQATSGSSCDQVYAGMQAMADHVGDAPPDQEQFLQACGALPDEVQRCMLPSYRMEHQESCESAYANLDPELNAAMERVWDNR